MLSESMQTAINAQINAELYSAYLYASMAAYYQSINLSGFANWMRVQVQEEMVHVVKFYDFLHERGGRVQLMAIAGPPTDWANPAAPLNDTYTHEVEVTRRIHNLVSLAMEERDYAANTFLDWFVNEQVEEESSADAVVRQLKLIGDDRSALFMLDRELATRVFVPPATGAGAAKR